jgi:glycosyltransferase involved in cell wall biosynthesis
MTDDLPFVSVVVPVFNGQATIAGCLASLTASDYPRDRREIVVVDNGSTDRTRELINAFDVTACVEPRRGASNARNRGVAASHGDVLAFTDADCVATSGWIREVAAAFESAAIGGVAGEILGFPPVTRAERYASRIRHLSPRRYLQRPIFPFAVTANLAFRRTVFERVGAFDATAPRGGESTDFCTRFFRTTDLELRFAPRAVVFHRHRMTAAGLFDQHWNYGRGHAFLYKKYRTELPWGWRERRQVYGDLAASARRFMIAGFRCAAGRQSRDDLDFEYFELLRKLAIRMGFVHEAVRRSWMADGSGVA